MKKREEFAVSLRKQKKERIIKDRRKRLMMTVMPSQVQNLGQSTIQQYHEDKLYMGCPLFKEQYTTEAEGAKEEDKISLTETLQRIVPNLPEEVVECYSESDEGPFTEKILFNKDEIVANKIEQITMLFQQLFNS